MDISYVIAQLKEGKRFKRDAWYDEARDARDEDSDYIFWQRGYPQGIPINQNTAEATGLEQGTICYFSAYLMRHFGGNVLAPYQLTAEDMAATDWEPFIRNPIVIGYNFEDDK